MKIFGIGLSKTGTTSLARALEILGYRTKDNIGVKRYVAGDLSSIKPSVLEENDAFTDTPIPSFYRELDAKYANSKFILTVRDTDRWLKSCKKQFNKKLADKQNEAHKALFMDLYGCIVFDEQRFKKGYERFVNDALRYFKDRPQDLLVLDVSAGEGWDKLCPFLGKAVPNVPFPKANVTQIRWMNITDIVAVAQEAGDEVLKIQSVVQPLRAGLKRDVNSPARAVKLLLYKVKYNALGSNADAARIAALAAHKTIKKRLNTLNAHIPVVFRCGDAKHYAERSNWNHYWLIDPLDNDKAFYEPGGTYTVNIALIEDGKPLLGVVYAPTIYTVYYAMAGKNAFKIEGNGEPRKVEPYTGRDPGSVSDAGNVAKNGNNIRALAPVSNALAICQGAEGKQSIQPYWKDTKEWHTAAAHVIVNAIGLQVTSHKTDNEPMDNKRA